MNEQVISKQDVLALLDTQLTCVVSTNGDDGYPNSATVAFSQNDIFEFVINTSRSSRKAGNIAKNNKVAITVTDTDARWTVQLEGDIRELPIDEFTENYSAKHYSKLPFTLPFKDIPDLSYFLVVPIHMKFTDASKQPWRVQEIDIA